MSKSVRCKFKVDSVEPAEGEAVATVRMSAVTTGSAENEAFWKYTPSGQLVFSTINLAAAEQLKPGAEFYIDITPA